MAQFRAILRALALALCATLFASPALAAECGINGSASAGQVDYDPFNPTGLGTTNITLNLTRINESGGSFTRSVFFYLKAHNASADSTEIIPISAVGAVNIYGAGLNIFYNYGASPPNLTIAPPTGGNRYLQVDFTGNNEASNTVQVNFTIKLPPNLNENAGSTLAFDVFYRCTYNPRGDYTGSIPNAITFPVRVLSALQAYFAGPALDFGEVGDKTDTDVTTTPIVRTGQIRVASSGVFTVDMTSQNGYKLTFPGGNLANATQTLGYQAKFVGQTRSPTNTTAVTKTCGRAGVPLASGQSLPIEVKLLNGGSTRTPAPNYSDNLLVTLTPQLSPTTAASCDTL